MYTMEHPFPLLSRMAIQGGLVPREHEIDAIKGLLARLGVNQRGWRMLLNFGETLFSPLMGALMQERRPLAAIENFSAFLALVQQCEMDVPPPPELSGAWARMKYPGQEHHLGDVPMGLFRAAWIEGVRRQYQGQAFQDLLSRELPMVVEWYFQRSAPLSPNQLRGAWAWCLQQAEAWRERCQHKLYLDEWAPLLDRAIEMRGVRVIELLAAGAVEDEATVMRHCIDSYIDACQSGDYRVFSLQVAATGERLATLGIFIDDDRWVIEDLRGQRNAQVDDGMWNLAELVRAYCNAASQKGQTELFREPKQPLPRR